MSTWYSAVVRCPSCGHDFEGRFVRGANASRAPELRAAALAGTLNRPPCPACGRAHDADAPLVYADPARGHWISVAHRADLARWAEVEPVAVAAFETGLETAPAFASGFLIERIRLVFDLDELRERLAIWDAGLDDGIVECVKLDCLRERPMLRGPAERIRFAGLTGGGLALTVIDAHLAVRADVTVAPGVLERIAADPAWRTQFPALFAPGFVSIDRYLR